MPKKQRKGRPRKITAEESIRKRLKEKPRFHARDYPKSYFHFYGQPVDNEKVLKVLDTEPGASTLEDYRMRLKLKGLNYGDNLMEEDFLRFKHSHHAKNWKKVDKVMEWFDDVIIPLAEEEEITLSEAIAVYNAIKDDEHWIEEYPDWVDDYIEEESP